MPQANDDGTATRRASALTRMGRALAGVLRSAWQEYERDYARYFAAAMIYYALLSLVPLLLLLLAALGLALRYSDLAVTAERRLLEVVQTGLGEEIQLSIGRALAQLEQQSVVMTIVSVVGLILTASKLFKHLRLCFRAIWKYAPPLVSGSVQMAIRASLTERMMAFALLGTSAALLVVAFALLTVIQWLSGLFATGPLFAHAPEWLLALPGPLLVAWMTFALLLKLLPPVPLRWRDVALAATLCAIAFIVGGELLLLGAAAGGGAYGALGTLLASMLWINIISQLLFYGGEVCKVVSTTPTEAP